MDRFSVGADPEFSCFKDGHYIRATQLYPTTKVKDKYSNQRIFGYDGVSATGEIRPAPTYNAEDFVNNIRKCLALGYLVITNHQRKSKKDGSTPEEIMAEIELKAGSYWTKPLGGHVHVGTKKFYKGFPTELEDCLLKPAQKQNIMQRHKSERKSWKYKYFIVNVLDATVGMGLKLVENWERGRTRVLNGYFGHFSNFHRVGWGIEYRTPPSWMLSPEMTKAVFELTQLSVYNVIENTEAIIQVLTEANLIDISPRDSEKTWKFIYENYTRDKFRSQFRDNWLRAIENFDLFNKTEFLNPLVTLIQNKEEWDDETNLFESWKIDKDTFDSLEFIDPLKWYKNYGYSEDNSEDLVSCPDCESTDRLDGELVIQLEDGELECPQCESTNVRRENYCFQCDSCSHHVCDFFLAE